MTSNDIMKKVRQAFFRIKVTEEQVKARTKIETERGDAEVLLIMDDVQSEGIDPRSPLGLACVAEIWKEKQKEIHREIHKGEPDPRNGGFPEGW
jgi:hypothetical protein